MEVPDVKEVDERKRSKKSKKRRPIQERNPGATKTVFHILHDEKSRVLTLKTAHGYHCFTRSTKSVNGRWRYQPTYFTTQGNAIKTIYADKRKTGMQRWVLTLAEGWKVAEEIKLLYVKDQYFCVNETERRIIEEGREQL